MELQRYWEIIQQRVCPKCPDGDGQGTCRLPAGESCALASFLPQIVATVANVKYASTNSYVSALQRNVCILCDHQTTDLSCNKRRDLECALDRYYPVVVEVIGEVREEMVRAHGGHVFPLV